MYPTLKDSDILKVLYDHSCLLHEIHINTIAIRFGAGKELDELFKKYAIEENELKSRIRALESRGL